MSFSRIAWVARIMFVHRKGLTVPRTEFIASPTVRVFARRCAAAILLSSLCLMIETGRISAAATLTFA